MLKLRKILGFCLLLMAINGTLKAQIRFQTVGSISGIYTADRLFQFTVLNTAPQAVNGQVLIKLRTLHGDLVAQYQSVPTLLKPLENTTGLQLDWLKNNDFGSSPTAVQFREQGVLPYGAYIVCYTFSDGKTRTSPSCSEIDSKPQMPPQLSFPSDKAVILTTNPLLTWIPPMPDYGTGFQYSLRLVELKSNQTCVQALVQNPSIVAERGQEETVYQITDANGLGLDTGKTYCWQVGAFTKNTNLGNTDIWQFTVGAATPTVVSTTTEPYILLKNGIDAECVRVQNGVLRVAFLNRFDAEKLAYIFRKEEARYTIPSPILLNLGIGMNYLDIPLNGNDLARNQSYVFELTDEENIKYYCRFFYEN